MNSLVHYLKNIEDYRHPKGKRHQLLPSLIIMIMAMTCGYTGLRAMARFAQIHRDLLKEYLPRPRGKAPSCPTLQRLSKGIDFTQVIHCFNEWMSQYLTGERIAIDGKSITSTVSSSQETDQNFVSLVSFFSQPRTLIVKVGAFENHQTSEIQVVQELLSQFEITTAVFTLDALHCQKKTVQAIIKSGNGYVITVKQNQPKLHAAIIKQIRTTQPLSTWSWTQKGHGHEVKCRLKGYSTPPEMRSSWSGLQRVISVNRRGERGGKSFDTTTCYITSESSRAYVFAQTLRGHRQIENNLHWVKDVIFKEDHCGIRSPPQAATLGVFRNFAFNLLVLEGFHSLTAGIQTVTGQIGRLWEMITISKEKSSTHATS
jgi:predicted transposase YbfD/YdcC